jgi:hypothetical protein
MPPTYPYKCVECGITAEVTGTRTSAQEGWQHPDPEGWWERGKNAQGDVEWCCPAHPMPPRRTTYIGGR